MKPAPFAYIAPSSLEEALATMAEHGYDAKLLAGGQSLVPTMNFRLVQPSVLVDLNPLADDLSGIQPAPDGGLRLGAMTRQRAVERSALVAERAPLLAEAMPHVAHPQIRNRGTVGGSLAHADPAGELPVIAVALDARFRLHSASRERWVDADDFFQGVFAVDLAPEEVLVEVEIPPFPAGSGWSFMEVARRHGDYALAGVAAWVQLDDAGRCQEARLVYLNAGDRPVDAQQAAGLLQGERLSDDTIAEAADLAASEEIDPTGDIHASIGYKRHLVRVLTGRALRAARERANGDAG